MLSFIKIGSKLYLWEGSESAGIEERYERENIRVLERNTD